MNQLKLQVSSSMIIVAVLSVVLVAKSQETVKVLTAISDSKRLNTLPLFEVKKEITKVEANDMIADNTEPVKNLKKEETNPKTNNFEKIKEPIPSKTKVTSAQKPVVKENIKPEVKSPSDSKVTENILSFKPTETPKVEVMEVENQNTKYFDKMGRLTKKDKSYYYRKAQFDERTGQPRDKVQDFYTNGDKPKFVGQYSRYNSDETNNNKYDGECVFYEENGAKSIRKYRNGRIIEETKYNTSLSPISQVEFNLEGKRKSFQEYIFDNTGKQIGIFRGGYNSTTNQEEGKQEIFGVSVIDFIGSCPKSKCVFISSTGKRYEAYSQDFLCEPSTDTEWKFVNSSNFQNSFKKGMQAYRVASTDKEQQGFIQLPITYDFYKKPFEMEAIFQIDPSKPQMAEFGIVWEYQNDKNYSFFSYNTSKKKFEVNAIKEGQPQKFMLGVNPIETIITGDEIKLVFYKGEGDLSYKINEQALKHKVKNGEDNFKKPVRIDLNTEFKTWGVGFYFKSQSPNETIILKHIDIKLL